MKIHFKLIGRAFSSLRGRALVSHSDDSSSVALYGPWGEFSISVGKLSCLLHDSSYLSVDELSYLWVFFFDELSFDELLWTREIDKITNFFQKCLDSNVSFSDNSRIISKTMGVFFLFIICRGFESGYPTVGHGCRSFEWDHINRGPVSQ
jgi:hypothetical protein